MNTITLQGMTVEADLAVVHYGRLVGENSVAQCHIDIPMSLYITMNGKELLKFIERMNITHDGCDAYESSYDNPLRNPAARTLQELLQELKFGRTGEDQDMLDSFIAQLNEDNDDI